MLTSLALIFLVGLAMGAICQRLKLPRIIGMLITGIVLGPYVLDFLDSSILSISADLRKMALIIILLKAGLSLDLNDLKKVGRPAIMLSFVPASFEIIGYVLLAPWILGITHVEAAVMGAVLAAVSPAVVVPRMVNLMESKYGTEKAIPQMIMAGEKDPGRGVKENLKLCNRVVHDIFEHGAGRKCKCIGFCKCAGFYCAWNSAGRGRGLWAVSVF